MIEVRPGVIATDMTAGVKENMTSWIADGLFPQSCCGKAGGCGGGGQRDRGMRGFRLFHGRRHRCQRRISNEAVVSEDKHRRRGLMNM